MSVRICDINSDSTGPRRGFTLVEIMVVVTILLIMAALIVPRLVAAQASRDRLDLEAQAARLPLECKNQAARAQQVCDLRLVGASIVLEQQPAAFVNGAAASGGGPTQIKSVNLGATLQVASLQLNGKTSDTGAWQWNAYPDGSTDRGAIEFTEGMDQTKSLIMSGTGNPTWSDGTLPDVSLDHWTAGATLEQRAGTSTSSGS